jgi:galactonate dehydratase
MKIERVETFLVEAGARNWLFTKITTDAGITGISETTIKRKERTLRSSVEELTRFLIGKDPTCIEDHYEKMYRDAFWVGGTMLSSAISAVEAALWDILGKSVGLPVYKLLGGPTREKIRVYCWIGAGKDASENAWKEAALMAVEQGFTAVKIGALGATSSYGSQKETEGLSPQAIRDVAQILGWVREAVGWKIDIAIDLGGRLNAANAIRLISVLDDLDLLFVEEPLPPENIDALSTVARAVRTPLATGERLNTKYGFRQLLEKQAVAVLQPDVCNCGGIMEAKKIAAMAEAWYVPVAPHNPNGPVATAMTAQVAACIPNFLIMETVGWSGQEKLRHEEMVQETLTIREGYLELPKRPGLGVELNDDAMARHPFVMSDARR